jgi:hypothetical protein
MTYVPANPDSIIIMPTCCQFNTVYPNSLNVIINENEYQQSISNINRVAKSPSYYITICFLFTVIPIIGTLGMIYSALSFSNPDDVTYILIFGVLILIVGPAITYGVLSLKQNTRLRKVINAESEKYATRLPISCTWQLEEVSTGRGSLEMVRNIIRRNQSVSLLDHFQSH